MAEEKILEGEVIEESKKVEPEEPKEEPKKEETEKEFFLIRGAKAIGHGVVKTGKAVGSFVKKHPYISSGISAGLGWAAKMGWDYLSSSNSEVAPVEDHEEPAMLPEPDEPDYDDYAEEPEMEPEAEPTIVSEE